MRYRLVEILTVFLFASSGLLWSAFVLPEKTKQGNKIVTPSFLNELKRDVRLGKVQLEVKRPGWTLPGSLLSKASPAEQPERVVKPVSADKVPLAEGESEGAEIWQVVILIGSLVFVAITYFKYRNAGPPTCGSSS